MLTDSMKDRQRQVARTDQVVIWPDTEEFPKVAEGDRGIGLEPEIAVMVCWGQVTPFTENSREH